MLKVIIFVVLSAGLAFASRGSLGKPRSHGFFRFFTFESVLTLVVLNSGHWFSDAFSPRQIISWLLLLVSLAIAVHGFYLLHQRGRPKSGIENTTILVRMGAYKYIRHPLYSSLLWFGWGAFLKDPSLLGSVLILAIGAFLIATARAEEAENLSRFGTDYAEYMKTTRMFLPFLF